MFHYLKIIRKHRNHLTLLYQSTNLFHNLHKKKIIITLKFSAPETSLKTTTENVDLRPPCATYDARRTREHHAQRHSTAIRLARRTELRPFPPDRPIATAHSYFLTLPRTPSRPHRDDVNTACVSQIRCQSVARPLGLRED